MIEPDEVNRAIPDGGFDLLARPSEVVGCARFSAEGFGSMGVLCLLERREECAEGDAEWVIGEFTPLSSRIGRSAVCPQTLHVLRKTRVYRGVWGAILRFFGNAFRTDLIVPDPSNRNVPHFIHLEAKRTSMLPVGSG